MLKCNCLTLYYNIYQVVFRIKFPTSPSPCLYCKTNNLHEPRALNNGFAYPQERAVNQKECAPVPSQAWTTGVMRLSQLSKKKKKKMMTKKIFFSLQKTINWENPISKSKQMLVQCSDVSLLTLFSLHMRSRLSPPCRRGRGAGLGALTSHILKSPPLLDDIKLQITILR